MAGFADFMGGNFQVGGSGGPIGVTGAKAPTDQSLEPKANGGGLAGFLYNSLIQPTANSVSGALGDALKIPSAIGGLGKIGAAEVTGNKTALANDLAKQNELLGSTNFAQNYEDPNLEKALGKSAGQTLNIAGPAAGGEELQGAKGLLAGAKAGAGIGAKLGALGGISGTAAQGSTNLGQFAEDTGGGAIAGGAIGALGGGLGGTLGKLTGRSADQAGAGADAAGGNQGNGILAKTANKAGARVANKEMAQSSIDFSGDANGEAKKVLSYDKNGGNPVGIQSVQGFLRARGMPDTAAGMEALSNISNRTIAPDLKNMAAGTNIDASQVNQVGTDSVRRNVGKPTGDLSGSGSATIAQRTINDATDKLGPQSTMNDILEARQKLASARATSQANTRSGDLVGSGVTKAYQDTIDRLDAEANKSGVNDAVANHHVSPEGEANIKRVVRDETSKLFGRPGDNANDQVAANVAREKAIAKTSQHYIDAENNAKSYENLISEQQIPTVAGQLARIAKDTFESAPTKMDKTTGRPQVPSWYLASALTGNPVGIGAVAAHLAESTHPIQGIAEKLNPDAFAAAKRSAMAPNEATQAKIDNPGTIGGAPTATEGPQSNAEKMGLPVGPGPLLSRRAPSTGEAMHPASPMSNEAATQPAQTAPPTPQAGSVQEPTGAGQYPTSVFVQHDMTQNPTAPAVPPTEAQPIGIRANANPSPGPEVNGISGPIPNSGTAMGAQPGAEQPVPVSSPTGAQPVATRPMQTTNVPVQAQGTGQASGEIPMAPPSALDRTLGAVTGGAHAIATRVQPAEEAIENAVGKIPGAIADRVRNSSPGNVSGAVQKAGVGSLIGALTGAGASNAGQNANAILQARKGGGPVSAAVSPNIPTSFVSANGSSQSGSANPNSVYPQANELADIMADPTHASTYETLYKDLNPAPTASQATGAQSIQDASSYINTIEQELNGFGGVNAIAGYESEIPLVGKYLQPKLTAYNQTKTDAATALAKALTGKSPSGAQVQAFALSLPSPTDSPEEAAQKIDNVRTELANKAGDYGLVPAQ